MNPNEEKIYKATGNFRTEVFRPLNKVLTRLGIRADYISYLGVVLMVLFIFTVPNHLMASFWLLFGRMLADIMDGPLARFQRTDSDRGKFVDVIMDNLSFGLFIFGLLRAGLLNALPGAIYLFITELVVVLMVIRYNFKHRSQDWFFYASAGALPYTLMYGAYITFSNYVFSGSNYLNGMAEIFSFLLAIKATRDYWAIQRTTKR